MDVQTAYTLLVTIAENSQGNGQYHRQVQLASQVLAQFIKDNLKENDEGEIAHD